MLSAKILFCICVAQYVETTLSNDVLIDDLPQIVKQIRQEIDLLKDENAKLKERNEIMEERMRNAILEDEIQERVERLEQLAKIGTLREALNKHPVFITIEDFNQKIFLFEPN